MHRPHRTAATAAACQSQARLFVLILLSALIGVGSVRADDVRKPRFPAEPEIGDPSLVPEGYVLVEGDMLFREDQLNKAGGFHLDFWPGGDIPYQWDAGLAQSRRDTVLAAMALVESVTNVDFRLRSGEADYIHVKWHATNTNSQVGMVGGRQLLNVADWATMWNLVHELIHALGCVHEQSRGDRDTYVTINWNQISQTACGGGPCDSNFTIDASTVEYGYYDFDSIMHYGQAAFAIGSNPTITCNTGYESWQTKIGQRSHLSELDVLTISFLYPEGDWRFVDDDTTILFELGQFLFPWGTFSDGMSLTPTGGTVWIQPGDYNGNGTYDEAIEIRAPLGGVTID